MAVKFIKGSYPQINGNYTTLNGTWSEKALKYFGHELVQLRLKEITLKSEGSTLSYDKIPDSEIPGLKDIKKAILPTSKKRSSFQIKTTLQLDMTLVTVKQVEDALRKDINARDKRNGDKVVLIVQTMVTRHKGRLCYWGRIDKGEQEGIKMILVYIDGQHVGKMSAMDRAAAMEHTWCKEVCDLTKKDFSRNKAEWVCPLSGTPIKQ